MAWSCSNSCGICHRCETDARRHYNCPKCTCKSVSPKCSYPCMTCHECIKPSHSKCVKCKCSLKKVNMGANKVQAMPGITIKPIDYSFKVSGDNRIQHVHEITGLVDLVYELRRIADQLESYEE